MDQKEMSTPSVQRKLRESHYFLRQLLDESKKAYRDDPEVIMFLFSAFSNATYSVHCALKKITGETQYLKFLKEWKKSALNDAERTVFDSMEKQRHDEVHEIESGASKALKSHVESRPEFPNFTVVGANTTVTVPLYEREECLDLGSGKKLIQKKRYHNPFVVLTIDPTSYEVEGEYVKAVDDCATYLNLLERLCEAFPKRKEKLVRSRL